jgi:predicted CoA-binding protein
MQEGIVHEAAARRAREAGMEVVMDRCMMKEHKKMIGGEM